MEMKKVGEGSQYPWSDRDSKGNPLDGVKNYKLHLPPNIPANARGKKSTLSNRYAIFVRVFGRRQR